MKIRTGFVSNSSSSSFIIWRKNDNADEVNKNNYKVLKAYGYDDEDIQSLLEDYKGKEIILADKVEHGAEDDCERIFIEMINKLVPNETIHFEWEEL